MANVPWKSSSVIYTMKDYCSFSMLSSLRIHILHRRNFLQKRICFNRKLFKRYKTTENFINENMCAFWREENLFECNQQNNKDGASTFNNFLKERKTFHANWKCFVGFRCNKNFLRSAYWKQFPQHQPTITVVRSLKPSSSRNVMWHYSRRVHIQLACQEYETNLLSGS